MQNWALPPVRSRSAFPPAHLSNIRCIHCARLSSQFSLLLLACTRIGARDRNTCTVCRSAAQKRISDIVLRVLKARSAVFRTASSAIPNECPACGLAVAHKCRPCERGIAAKMTSGISRRCPGIHAGGICDRTKRLLPIVDASRNGTLSRVRRPEHKGAEL